MHLNNCIILNNTDPEFFTRYQVYSDNRVSKSIIDHFHSNLQSSHSFSLFIGESSLSDHNFLLLTVNKILIPSESPLISRKVTNYKNVSCKLKTLLAHEFNDFDSFHSSLVDIIKSETNIVTGTNCKRNAWFDVKLKRLWKEKVKFSKLKVNFPQNDFFKSKYLQISKQLKVDIFIAKKKFYSSLLSKNSGNPKKTWDIINEMIGRKKSSKSFHNMQLRIDDSLINNSFTVANKLNEYFVNVGKPEDASSNVANLSAFEFEEWEHNNELFSEFEPVTESNVTEIIKSFKSNVAMGEDDISVKFLKYNIQLLAPLLTTFINQCFKNAEFPSSLKFARVSPIFKSDDPEIPSNYRPISILSILTKLFESCMKSQLLLFLNDNKIIHQQQYGFLPNSCTTAAASCLANDIVSSLNSSKKTAVVTLDIAKAFDCVSHTKFAEILMRNGIVENARKLLSSYFQNRSQSVYVNGCKSKNLNVEYGCPQGSVLGPLIFLIYINGLLRLKLNGNLRLFADDAALVISANSYDDLHIQITEDLLSICSFLASIDFRLNTKKTNFTVFSYGTKKDIPFDVIKINNESIYRVSQFNYLGIIFDQNLNWKMHVQHVLKKINPYVNILSKIRHYVEKKALMMFYYAHIHSHLTYCLPVWQNISGELKSLLQRAQNKAVKYINFLPPLTPTAELYDEKLLKFSDHINYENILFIHKVVTGLMRCDLKLGTNFDSFNVLQSSIFFRGVVEYNQFIKHLNAFNKTVPPNLSQLKSEMRNFVRLP